MNIRLSSAIISIAVLASCSGPVTTDTPSASIDSLMRTYFAPDAPGALVMVVRDDTVVFNHGYGLADIVTRNPVTDSTMFNICSVSKQFSAMALLRLAEQGKLSLDDKVSDYFPEFKAPFFREITLAQLLSHSSGLPDARPRTREQWERYTACNRTEFANVHDFRVYSLEDESIRFFENLDSLAFAPGSRYEYQNPTYQLVYYIVPKVTGVDFDTWMRDNIFLPAGMTETVYFEPDRDIPRMAHGYRPSETENFDPTEAVANTDWEEWDYGEANFFPTKADGGIYTSGRDFIKWQKALMNGGLVSDSTLREAFAPRVLTDIPDTWYGYGFFIERRPGMPEKIFHTGDNGGFYIYEGEFPEKKLFYLIFATQDTWPRERVAAQVDSIFLSKGWL